MWITDEGIKRPARRYLSEDFNVEDWNEVKKALDALLAAKAESKEGLENLIAREFELSSVISEEMAKRYIEMTRFADVEANSTRFNEFYSGVVSKTEPYSFEFKKMVFESPFLKELPADEYGHYINIISNDMDLFREENIPLKVSESELSNRYGAINSALTAEFRGEEKTMSQLSVYLKDADRSVREEAWRLRMNTMAGVKSQLDDLFDEMKDVRGKQASNAGFDNYRDFKHKEMGRFSYTPGDLFQFHKAVEDEVVPFLRELNKERKDKLGVDVLRPWDTSVDLDGKTLKPFNDTEEFVKKAVSILSRVKKEYGLNLNRMYNAGLLDLENRKGKAPGGYNYPLAETGAPFIFMNSVGLHRDVVTLLHESGHAMHTFASKGIRISPYRHTPSEVAELASMSMELLTMDKWDEYYSSQEDLKKAQRDELEGTLKFLPWCMTVDAFQHWIYTNPDHTVEERDEYFASLMDRFNTGVDTSGLENEKKISWMYQLHIFEVPFYYIEYGMAQLGALSVYHNYMTGDRHKAVDAYDNFLGLAYTKPVRDLYESAGIKFDFSSKHISELVDFVKNELKKLN